MEKKLVDLLKELFEHIIFATKCCEGSKCVCDEVTYDIRVGAIAQTINEIKKLAKEKRIETEVERLEIDLGDGVKLEMFGDDPAGCHNSGGWCDPRLVIRVSRSS